MIAVAVAFFLMNLWDLGEGGDSEGVVWVCHAEGVVVEAVDNETDGKGEECHGQVERELAVIDFVAHRLMLIICYIKATIIKGHLLS